MKISRRTYSRWKKYQGIHGIPLLLSEILGPKWSGPSYELGYKGIEYLKNILHDKAILYAHEIKKELIRKHKHLKDIDLTTIYRSLERICYTHKKLWTIAVNYDFYQETLFWWKVHQIR